MVPQMLGSVHPWQHVPIQLDLHDLLLSLVSREEQTLGFALSRRRISAEEH